MKPETALFFVEDNQGKVWVVDNSEGSDEIEKTFESVVSELKVK